MNVKPVIARDYEEIQRFLAAENKANMLAFGQKSEILSSTTPELFPDDCCPASSRKSETDRMEAERRIPAHFTGCDLKKQSQFAPAQISAKSFLKGDYENRPRRGLRKSKANQSQFQQPGRPADGRSVERVAESQHAVDDSESKMVNPEVLRMANLKKQSQFVPARIGARSFVKGDYGNKPAREAEKNKPNQSQFRDRPIAWIRPGVGSGRADRSGAECVRAFPWIDEAC